MSSIVCVNNASSAGYHRLLTSCRLRCSGWVEAIKNIHATSFLGLDSVPIFPRLERYVQSQSIPFTVLSELGLSTLRNAIADSYKYGSPPPNFQWLYKQYCRYAIGVHDFGNKPTEYLIPLLETAVVPGYDQVAFEHARPEEMSKLLPEPTLTFRLIIFPQTRYSFIADEVERTMSRSKSCLTQRNRFFTRSILYRKNSRRKCLAKSYSTSKGQQATTILSLALSPTPLSRIPSITTNIHF